MLRTAVESCSEELRKRFLRAETTLFRLRFESDDRQEREAYLKSLNLDWTPVRSTAGFAMGIPIPKPRFHSTLAG